jgi:cell fate regulator YaaT (PSP1 superfamily)
VHPLNAPTNLLIRYGYEARIASLGLSAWKMQRGDHVVVRTERGVELAEVLSLVSEDQSAQIPQAKWLRRARSEDLFLRNQLTKISLEARSSCQRLLEETGSEDVLLEVEPMLDGRTLCFHFLGEPSSQSDAIIGQLSSVYEEQVRNSKFATLLETGCGPGCGTEEKSSCGTSKGCSSCAVSGRCGK